MRRRLGTQSQAHLSTIRQRVVAVGADGFEPGEELAEGADEPGGCFACRHDDDLLVVAVAFDGGAGLHDEHGEVDETVDVVVGEGGQ